MKSKLQYIFPVLLLICGLYSMPLKIIETNLSKMPGDLGDTRFNNYILEHGHKYLTGQIDSFWNAPFLYPYKNVTALSDNLIGTLPIYSVFRFGTDRETSFLLWIISLFVLNYIFCFIALKKWSGENILSSVGAYIFAFSIYNLGQFDHVQVLPKFIAPLVIFWCWKFLSEGKSKYFIFMSLGLIYQFYCGIYLAFLLIYILMFLSISYFIVYKDFKVFSGFKEKKYLATLAVTIIASIVLLFPLIQPYLDVAKTMGMRKFESAFSTIPHLRSYFFATPSSAVWNVLSDHGIGKLDVWWNHYLFVGALPWIGVLTTVFLLFFKKNDKLNKKQNLFFLTTLFLCVIFCLNINGFTLYEYIFKIPGFSSMRSIDRIINLEVFVFILVFVFSFKSIIQAFPKMQFLLYLLPVLVVIENQVDASKVKRFDKETTQSRIADVKASIKKQYDPKYSAIAYMAFHTYVGPEESGYMGYVARALDVMIACQELNIKCVNSYTGFDPGNYLNFFYEPRDRTLKEWCEFNKTDYSLVQHLNDFGRKEISRTKINLKAFNGKYISAIDNENPVLEANRDIAQSWETFLMIRFENGECMIKAQTNLILHLEKDSMSEIKANKITGSEEETFRIIEFSDSTVAFQAPNGKYLTVDSSTSRIAAKAPVVGVAEKFRIIEL